MSNLHKSVAWLPLLATVALCGCAVGRLGCGETGCDTACAAPMCGDSGGNYCGSGMGSGSGIRLCGGDDGPCCLGTGWLFRRRCFSVPDTLPLGSTVRAHYHTMQTNAEASEFVLFRYDFVDFTPALTPAGRDRIVEIAARAKSAPFPILVERSENNSDPELDAARRNLVAQILTDFGVPEANQRVIVSPPYGRQPNSIETQVDYYQMIYSSGGNGIGGNVGGFGGNAGIGIGGAGGVGF